MVQVKCEYINIPKKSGTDYFVFVNFEVSGHAEHTGYDKNIKVCAGISACCYGINRLINSEQYSLEYKSGYFHCWTDRIKTLKALDKDSVYALNTLVCQLYEIYCQYPNAFKSFEIVDVKEKYDYERKQNTKHKHRKQKHRVGLNCLIQETHLEEN